MKTYRARWSSSLMIISLLTAVLCVGIAIATLLTNRAASPWIALPLGILAVGGLFTVRGYTIASDAILIHRLFWATRMPLVGLESAEFTPDAMGASIRTFGNGGLFSFTGYYRNKMLGTYRAFVTDPHQTVVLHFPSRTVVVSPSLPEEFVRDLRTERALA